MIVIFLYGIAPREYLHDLFAHHHDTQELLLKKGQTALTNKHTHCSFLGIDFGPFVAAEKQYFVFEYIAYPSTQTSAVYHTHFFTTYKKRCLRGPPVPSFA